MSIDKLPVPIRRRGSAFFLSDARVRAWVESKPEVPRGKRRKLSDGGRLYCELRSTGGTPTWIQVVTVLNKTVDVKVGIYPDNALTEVRENGRRAREMAAQGTNPNQSRREELQRVTAETKLTLEAIAELYLLEKGKAGDETKRKTKNMWAKHFHSEPFWKKPIEKISAKEVRDVVRKIAESSREMASRAFGSVKRLNAFAIDEELTSAIHLMHLKELPVLAAYKEEIDSHDHNYPAITDIATLGRILHQDQSSTAGWQVRFVHRVIAYTAVRDGNAVNMRWAHIDMEKGIWSIPREEMKFKKRRSVKNAQGLKVFEVPLSWQMMEMLRGLDKVSDYVFHSEHDRNKPITTNAISAHLRIRLGLRGKHVPHGWRSSFSTWGNEENNDDEDRRDKEAIELILDHRTESHTESTYNRARYLERKRRVLQFWADTLTKAELDAQNEQ